MPTAVVEEISPELALVCPDLAARAREVLPERDPDGFMPMPRNDPASESALTPKTWLAAAAYGLASTAILMVEAIALVVLVVLALTLAAGWAAAGR